MNDVINVLKLSLELNSAEDDPRQPYKSKYKAADVLAEFLTKGFQPSLDPSLNATSTISKDRQLSAIVRMRRGLILLETDLLSEGEALVKAALDVLSGEQTTYIEHVIEGLNALGALYCGRGDFATAAEQLTKAELLYAQRSQAEQGAASDTCSEDQSKAGQTPGGGGKQHHHQQQLLLLHSLPCADLEVLHTSTLFYLAQVCGHQGNDGESAKYCGATLNRQLRAGEYDASTWVQNCAQLSTYFCTVADFACAEYCLLATQAVAEAAAARGARLADDVAASQQRAWGRLFLARLLDLLPGTGQEGPVPPVKAAIHFDGLDLPDLSSLPRGPRREEGAGFDAARMLFNAGLPHFNAALRHYQLDGWVTEHVDLALDVSNMYRTLALFEEEPKRRAAMHVQRSNRVGPLHRQLNPQHYLGQVRSIELELGNIWHDVAEAREEEAGGARTKKSVAANAEAALHYSEFLETYVGAGGKLPDSLDKEDESAVLMAAFSLGRVAYRTQQAAANGAVAPPLPAAFEHMHWAVDYVRSHKILALTEHAELASEMMSLVEQRGVTARRGEAITA